MHEGKEYLTSKVPIGTPTTVTVNSTMAASAIHTSQSNNISLRHAAQQLRSWINCYCPIGKCMHIIIADWFQLLESGKMLELSLAFESLLHGALIGKQI